MKYLTFLFLLLSTTLYSNFNENSNLKSSDIQKSDLFNKSVNNNFSLKLNNNNYYNDDFKFGPAAMLAGGAMVGIGYFTYLRQRRVVSNNSRLGNINPQYGGPLSNFATAFPIVIGGSLVITGGVSTIMGK